MLLRFVTLCSHCLVMRCSRCIMLVEYLEFGGASKMVMTPSLCWVDVMSVDVELDELDELDVPDDRICVLIGMPSGLKP